VILWIFLALVSHPPKTEQLPKNHLLLIHPGELVVYRTKLKAAPLFASYRELSLISPFSIELVFTQKELPATLKNDFAREIGIAMGIREASDDDRMYTHTLTFGFPPAWPEEIKVKAAASYRRIPLEITLRDEATLVFELEENREENNTEVVNLNPEVTDECEHKVDSGSVGPPIWIKIDCRDLKELPVKAYLRHDFLPAKKRGEWHFPIANRIQMKPKKRPDSFKVKTKKITQEGTFYWYIELVMKNGDVYTHGTKKSPKREVIRSAG